MSTGLTSRVWLDDAVAAGSTPARRLHRLLEIAEGAAIQAPWSHLTVRSGDLSKRLLELSGPLARAQIDEALNAYTGEDVHLCARGVLPCWRIQHERVGRGSAVVRVEAWGQGYLESAGRLRGIEGDAAITIDHVESFVLPKALAGTGAGAVDADETAARVQDNLQTARALLLAVAADPRTSLLKAFTAQGLYQPLNAHLLYFRRAEELLPDFALLETLWHAGLPAYGTPPLQDALSMKLDRYALNPWRSLESSERVVAELARLVDRARDVDAGTVEAIDWGSFNFFASPAGGRVILDEPYWVDRFVDRFYIEVLGAVATGGRGAG